MQCSVDGCDRSGKLKRGWCGPHYKRWWRNGDPQGVRAERGDPAEFIDQVLASDTDVCIEWPYGRATRGGYGVVSDPRAKTRIASRAVLILHTGETPSQSIDCAHNCGNPPCVNPRHLRWATRKSNHADQEVHGTMARGVKHGQAKIDDETVREIRSRIDSGEGQSQIARSLGISPQLVCDIKKGRRWAHVV